MTSDSAPTVAVNHITRVKEYVTDDLLEPLDELAEAQQVDWTDFTQKLQVASMVDGVHYCMPIDTHLLLMHYNVDEFKNMGLLADDSTVVVPKGEEAFFEFFENVKAQLDGGKWRSPALQPTACRCICGPRCWRSTVEVSATRPVRRLR